LEFSASRSAVGLSDWSGSLMESFVSIFYPLITDRLSTWFKESVWKNPEISFLW
jgi:hypothetical protein